MQNSAQTGDYAAHVVDSPTQEHPSSLRQQTGRNTVTIDESRNSGHDNTLQSLSRDSSGNADLASEDTLTGNNGHKHHDGISEKLHNVRHRAHKRGNKDVQVSDEKHHRKPQPQRSFSTGPRGFMERVMTVCLMTSHGLDIAHDFDRACPSHDQRINRNRHGDKVVSRSSKLPGSTCCWSLSPFRGRCTSQALTIQSSS